MKSRKTLVVAPQPWRQGQASNSKLDAHPAADNVVHYLVRLTEFSSSVLSQSRGCRNWCLPFKSEHGIQIAFKIQGTR